MQQVAAILFDKDGTLFDFNATWGVWAAGLIEAEAAGDAALMAAMADVMRFDRAARRFARDSPVIAGTTAEVAELILPFLSGAALKSGPHHAPPGDARAALIARMNDRAALAPQVEVTALGPLMAALSGRGLRLAVITNDAEAPARAHLAAAGVAGCFDFVAGFDSGHGGKPAPGQLLAFCAATGLAPDRCAMVGDSLHDLHAARSAGMIAVAVTSGLATAEELAPLADVVLGSIAELPDWLDRL